MIKGMELDWNIGLKILDDTMNEMIKWPGDNVTKAGPSLDDSGGGFYLLRRNRG